MSSMTIAMMFQVTTTWFYINAYIYLLMCVACNSADVIEALCQHGADLSLVDNVGATALHYAAQLQDSSHAPADTRPALSTLLDTGMSADLRDDDGRTPLMWAATSGN